MIGVVQYMEMGDDGIGHMAAVSATVYVTGDDYSGECRTGSGGTFEFTGLDSDKYYDLLARADIAGVPVESSLSDIAGDDENITLLLIKDTGVVVEADAVEEETSIEAPPKPKPKPPDTYFCGSNASIYLYPKDSATPFYFELDVPVFQWNAIQNNSPLYSHNGMHWDDLMMGQYIIKGGFALNLRQAFQLQLNLGTDLDNPLTALYPFNIILQLIHDFSPTVISRITYEFEDAHISAMSQIITPDGEPIGENYEFIARKVRVVDNLDISDSALKRLG